MIPYLDLSKDYLNYNNISITFNPSNTWINDSKMENGELESTLLEFIEFSSEGKQTMLHLNFNQNLSYQDYLFYFTLIKSMSINPRIGWARADEIVSLDMTKEITRLSSENSELRNKNK